MKSIVQSVAWVFLVLSISCVGLLMLIWKGIQFNERERIHSYTTQSQEHRQAIVFDDEGFAESSFRGPTTQWVFLSIFGVRIDPSKQNFYFVLALTMIFGCMSIVFFLVDSILISA